DSSSITRSPVPQPPSSPTRRSSDLTGTYYRAGEGLVGSWLALIFYALSSAFMKLGPAAGFTEGIRSITLDNGSLQASTGLSPWVFVVLISAIAVWQTVHHARKLKTPMAAPPPRRSAEHTS